MRVRQTHSHTHTLTVPKVLHPSLMWGADKGFMICFCSALIIHRGSGDQHIIGDGPVTCAELLLRKPVDIVSRVIIMFNREYMNMKYPY